MPPPRVQRLALLALPLFLAASGCKDDESPTAPTPVAGAASGAQQVRGTERLAWSQTGDASRLRFRAYVDGRAVDLPGATCTPGAEADCQSPLPSLTDGVHTIEVVSISSGTESARSAPITLQKVSASSLVATLALASSRSGPLRLETVITIADDLAFTADIVATGVRAPAQLAWLPDGRLLVSDAGGRVRVVRPGEPENPEPALEAGMLTSLPVGPMGLASHPDFAENRFVYVSLLEEGRSGQTRLRIVRLREVGDTLGEPATLFEAPVVDDGTASQAGPRMAFGPDRILYLMLPPGMAFVNEPAASTPRASMLRLADDGRVTPGEPLSGITSTPLAFTWHPATGALWVMFRGENGEAAVRSIGGAGRVQTMRANTPRLRVREGEGAAAGTLLLESGSAPDEMLVAQTLLGTRADGSRGLARMALPLQSATGGMSDRVGDVVAGDGGTLFVVTSNGLLGGDVAATASDVIVRLRPLQAPPAR
jgi:glucose/arabinose dehydrogenase